MILGAFDIAVLTDQVLH